MRAPAPTRPFECLCMLQACRCRPTSPGIRRLCKPSSTTHLRALKRASPSATGMGRGERVGGREVHGSARPRLCLAAACASPSAPCRVCFRFQDMLGNGIFNADGQRACIPSPILRRACCARFVAPSPSLPSLSFSPLLSHLFVLVVLIRATASPLASLPLISFPAGSHPRVVELYCPCPSPTQSGSCSARLRLTSSPPTPCATL